ncbi:MAG: hypothetical protein Q4C64_01345 [Erysipelotrichia bacterium]|nr:hypothetical protein [Erysipelotrichia bacterium]
MTDTNIITYECNWSGQYCEVSYQSRTFDQFAKIAPYVIYVVKHNYTGSCLSNNQKYHKQYCSTSECNGWRYEEHYSSYPGSNATCAACGYTGSISQREPLGYN